MNATQDKAAGAAPKRKVDWASEARQIFWLVLAVLAVHSLLAKPFYIPSESMLPTLLTGDRLIVSKYPYGYSYLSPSFNVLPYIPGRLFGRLPERGDIAVIKSPQNHEDYIKRVIALPGDTVQMKDGQLWLNGEPVAREAMPPADIPVSGNTDCLGALEVFRVSLPDGSAVCRYPRFRETLTGGVTYETLDLGPMPQDNTEPMLVPEGHIFLMGDNRDNSEDSRFTPLIGGLGMLPIENLVGRAEFTTFSLDGSGDWWNPLSWIGSLRGDRAFLSLRPDRK